MTSIAIHIPWALRAECGGASELAVAASTVRHALEQLERDYPAIYRSVCDETGAVRRHINLFVNHAFLQQRQGLDTTLAPGDTLSIMTAVSGG